MDFRKLTASVLAAMTFAACTFSCGSSDSSSKTPSATPAADSSETKTESESTAETVTTQEQTEPPTEAVTEAEDVEFKRGMITGNTYQLDMVNFKFNAPDDFCFLSDEEILSISGLMDELPEDDALIQAAIESMESGASFVDASADGDTANLTFCFENLNEQGVDPEIYTSKSYAEVSKNTYMTMTSATNFSEIKSFKLGNDEYFYFDYTDSTDDSQYNHSLVIKKVGNYMFEIVFTSATDSFEDYIQYFDCIS